MNCVLIDMSGVFGQEGFTGLPSVDLKGLEGTNCYCSPEAASAIRRELARIPLSTACWIDTGDYHYLSYFRGCMIKEPFELVLLDNHTDDFDDADCLSCGNWVRALRHDSSYLSFRPSSLSFRPSAASGEISNLPVFLSIDLDVLSPADFRTNWDQGTMTFDELLDTVRRIAAERRIIAVDICGGITESKGALSCDLSFNRLQRRRLLELLEKIFAE